MEKKPLFFLMDTNVIFRLLFVNFFFPVVLILESSFLPDCIPYPAQISPFQSPPNPFVHREGSDPSPRELPCQELVRGDSAGRVAVVVFVIIIVVCFSPPIVSVILSKDLGPVRNVYRQRSDRRGAAIA